MDKALYSKCRTCNRAVHPSDLIFEPMNNRIGCVYCLDIIPKQKERINQFISQKEKITQPITEKLLNKKTNTYCKYCRFRYFYNEEKEYPKNCPNCNKTKSSF
ncbi:MAG TPA: hypothetical protein VJB89_02430 [Candidatus Nanoarchaeia archaeon]|nr:hypothetical protein [Candidatus Nanoarchaeia archaeon]